MQKKTTSLISNSTHTVMVAVFPATPGPPAPERTYFFVTQMRGGDECQPIQAFMSPMILPPSAYADGQHVGCGCSKSPSETDMTRMAAEPASGYSLSLP